MKYPYMIFYISLIASVPNFKVQWHFHQKLELLGSNNHYNFYKTYTAKTPLTFFQKNVCAQRDENIEYSNYSGLW